MALATGSGGGAPGAAPVDCARPPRGPRLRRRLAWLFGGIAAGAGLVLAAGFVWFAFRVPAEEVSLTRNADGIVVLTGGSSRIADAIELLASGRGQRLLISGVHRATNRAEILRLLPEHEDTVRCCVDLDRSAVNTLGNAVGTREWVKDRGFHSLIVVTSNYHMPRAMAELSHQLPGVALIPFPVVSEKVRAEPWWSHSGTAKLLVSEYVKYNVAVLRMQLDPHATAQASKISDVYLPLLRKWSGFGRSHS
jgi:uncharacterized SAM-binding protein YcdF (DUF218 family)